MSKLITLRIPTKKYVQAYLDTFYPEYTLKPSERLGMFLFYALRNYRSRTDYNDVVLNYPTQFGFDVPKKLVFDAGLIRVTSLLAVNFNNFIDEEIKQQFDLFMLAKDGLISYKDAILEFMDLFQIGDDDGLSFDALKQRHFRKRKKLEKARV